MNVLSQQLRPPAPQPIPARPAASGPPPFIIRAARAGDALNGAPMGRAIVADAGGGVILATASLSADAASAHVWLAQPDATLDGLMRAHLRVLLACDA